MKVAIIGPICKDEIIINNKKTSQMGGLTYYCGNALFNLGVKVTVFGTFGQGSREWLKNLKCQRLVHVPTKSTIKFINEYPKANSDYRLQRAEIFQNSITIKSLKKHDFNQFDFVVLGPLFHDNLSLAVVKYLRKFKTQIVLAPQGLIRYLSGTRIIWKNPKNAQKLLKHIDYLILDERELKFISQKQQIQKAIDFFNKLGLHKIIMTQGRAGSWLFLEAKKQHIKFFPPKRVVDPTGAGDSYLAGIIKAKELFNNPRQQGEFAAMVATLAIEKPGPFENNLKTVLTRLKT
ncbi:MAG: PfkB family carbohydrate kinase [Patescibacteria group bacterium]|jgi:sugar/nucleoside kinase (ribokinase family)